MYGSDPSSPTMFEDPSVQERRDVVRLCAWLSGDREAAEDLAQETLLEAWRNAHKLRDPSGRAPWLAAIARHVCLRWRQRQARLLRREIPMHGDTDTGVPVLGHPPSHEGDLLADLERDDLVALLDQALALLPADTRNLLVARYVDETEHADLAARAGVSEATVRLRLHRGRRRLRHVLTTTLREAAAPYGLVDTASDDWQATQIWCPLCGTQRLMCRFLRATGSFLLRCPACCPQYRSSSSPNIAYYESAELFCGITGFKPALTRLMRFGDAYYQHGLAAHATACLGCGRELPVQLDPPAYHGALAALFGTRGVYTFCELCLTSTDLCLKGIALWSAHGRQFWQHHLRIRALPDREIVVAECPAIMVAYRSMQDDASLEILFARDTYRIIGAHITPIRPVVVASAQRGQA